MYFQNGTFKWLPKQFKTKENQTNFVPHSCQKWHYTAKPFHLHDLLQILFYSIHKRGLKDISFWKDFFKCLDQKQIFPGDILNDETVICKKSYSILVEQLQIIQHERIPKYHNTNKKAGQQKVNLTNTDNIYKHK